MTFILHFRTLQEKRRLEDSPKKSVDRTSPNSMKSPSVFLWRKPFLAALRQNGNVIEACKAAGEVI